MIATPKIASNPSDRMTPAWHPNDRNKWSQRLTWWSQRLPKWSQRTCCFINDTQVIATVVQVIATVTVIWVLCLNPLEKLFQWLPMSVLGPNHFSTFHKLLIQHVQINSVATNHYKLETAQNVCYRSQILSWRQNVAIYVGLFECTTMGFSCEFLQSWGAQFGSQVFYFVLFEPFHIESG